jgi:formate-dependent phosphoribosylglycinamide formyltransferase (GAR transformylase)
VQTLEEAVAAWKELGQNCMIKMVDGAASRNVFRVASPGQLEEAWNTIVASRETLTKPFVPSSEVILEEFVGGRELTVEGYVHGERIVCLNFCEKITEPGFIVVGHLLPALVSSEETAILQQVAAQVVRAEGMRNSVFHIELHLQENKPYVIECAARPPGKHMVELMFRSYGFDLVELNIRLATGEPVMETPRPPGKHFALLALYSYSGGILERIEGLEELQQHSGVQVLLNVKPGDRIEPLSGTHQMDGLIILEEDDALELGKKVAWVRTNVRLRLAAALQQDLAHSTADSRLSTLHV